MKTIVTNCVRCILSYYQSSICCTNPGALQDTTIIQLPKANIVNYNNFITLFPMHVLIRCIPNSFIHVITSYTRCCKNCYYTILRFL